MKAITVTLNRKASRLLRKYLRENPTEDVRDVVSGAIHFLLDDVPEWSGDAVPMARAQRLMEAQKEAA